MQGRCLKCLQRISQAGRKVAREDAHRCKNFSTCDAELWLRCYHSMTPGKALRALPLAQIIAPADGPSVPSRAVLYLRRIKPTSAWKELIIKCCGD